MIADPGAESCGWACVSVAADRDWVARPGCFRGPFAAFRQLVLLGFPPLHPRLSRLILLQFGSWLTTFGVRLVTVALGRRSALSEPSMIPLAVPAAETSLTAAESPELAGYFCVESGPFWGETFPAGDSATPSYSGAAAGGPPTFVGDDSNPLVRWVVQVLEQPLRDATFFAGLWPLTMVGPPGVGKSVLAAGLVTRLTPSATVAVVQTTADDLARSFQSALDVNALADWRSRLDSAAVVLVEQLPRLAPHALLQQQLAEILDARGVRGLPTVLISTDPLVRCGLSDRLLSRLQMGFTLPVVTPGPAALRVLVLQAFERAGLTISRSQLERLLVAGLRDPAVIRSIAHRWLLERGRAPFDLALAPASIHECLGSVAPAPVQPEVVLRLTAKLFHLSVKDLRGSARTSTCCRARALAMWVCRQYLRISYQQIGHLFGNRDHSTVLSSCKKMDALLPNDVFLQATLQQLLSRLPLQLELARA